MNNTKDINIINFKHYDDSTSLNKVIVGDLQSAKAMEIPLRIIFDKQVHDSFREILLKKQGLEKDLYLDILFKSVLSLCQNSGLNDNDTVIFLTNCLESFKKVLWENEYRQKEEFKKINTPGGVQ